MWDGSDNRPDCLLHCSETQDARRWSSVSRPQYLLNFGSRLEPAAISPCTFTMDHNAIICFMTDGLARGPDKDVHVPNVGSIKVPFSWCRCHTLVVDYRWGSMGSNESANTIPTTPCATRSAPCASAVPRPHYLVDTGQNLDPRVPATPPPRWIITQLFYSRSTDLPVLR